MSRDTRLSVYLRAPVPPETERRQASVLGRAQALRASGLVGDVTVTYWRRLANGLNPGEAADIERLEQWASDHGCSLAPSIDHRQRDSVFDGADSVVTLPLVCLAYWEGDELLSVYPHRGPCGHCTVADGLDRIEAALRSGEPLQTGSQR